MKSEWEKGSTFSFILENKDIHESLPERVVQRRRITSRMMEESASESARNDEHKEPLTIPPSFQKQPIKSFVLNLVGDDKSSSLHPDDRRLSHHS